MNDAGQTVKVTLGQTLKNGDWICIPLVSRVSRLFEFDNPDDTTKKRYGFYYASGSETNLMEYDSAVDAQEERSDIIGLCNNYHAMTLQLRIQTEVNTRVVANQRIMPVSGGMPKIVR
jgi:hypothetical protein